MSKDELQTALSKTDIQDRDILSRVITGFKPRGIRTIIRPPGDNRSYFVGELNHYDIAEDLGLTSAEAAHRLGKLAELQLVEQRTSEGWVYIGGRVSEFFELWNELEFC